MWSSAIIAFTDSRIRVAALTLFCLGFTFASTFPYLPIIGTRQLGMPEQVYALLSVAMAVAGMAGGLLIGHFSDLAQDRKRLIMLSLAAGLVGYGGFALWPSRVTFLVCLLLVMPLSTSAYGQLFAVIRSISQERGPKEAASINSIIRSVYAGSWIIVPGLVGAFIATRQNVSDSFVVAAAAFGLCLVMYGMFGSSGGRVAVSAQKPWDSLREAIGLVLGPRISLRLVSLALIACVYAANASILPLFVLHFEGGNTRDVGILAGLVAALEIPFMLLGGWLNRRFATWTIIATAGLLHACYFLGLSFVTAIWQVYGLAIFNAAGAAVVLSLHLSYVQDLLPERPGLGTSLMSVGGLLNKLLGAAIFALVGTVLGYSGALICGAALTVAGCVAVFLLDKGRGLTTPQ
jgi:MFS family permease